MSDTRRFPLKVAMNETTRQTLRMAALKAIAGFLVARQAECPDADPRELLRKLDDEDEDED